MRRSDRRDSKPCYEAVGPVGIAFFPEGRLGELSVSCDSSMLEGYYGILCIDVAIGGLGRSEAEEGFLVFVSAGVRGSSHKVRKVGRFRKQLLGLNSAFLVDDGSTTMSQEGRRTDEGENQVGGNSVVFWLHRRGTVCCQASKPGLRSVRLAQAGAGCGPCGIG